MNRRQYIQAVGASVALPLTACQATARGDGEKRPVYYTVSVPEIDTQILHISIPRELLNASDHLLAESEELRLPFDIAREATENPWKVLNLSVQTNALETVTVGDVEATRWDSLEMDTVALLVSGDADHSYLGVVGGGAPVHVDGVNHYWTWEEPEYRRVRVETTAVDDIEAKIIVDGDLERIPIFPMTPVYIA